jgi:uncharacterized protein YndB with AHSA1/START domain
MTENNKFIITRSLNAPRELVWKAWTQPEHLTKWLSPQGAEMSVGNMDLRVGGKFHYGMKGPDGSVMWGRWVFREITPLERLVLIQSFSDSEGGVTRHPLGPTWPLETLATTVLTEDEGKTLLTLTWQPFNATDEEITTFNASHDSMNGGWEGTFSQFETYLESIQ